MKLKRIINEAPKVKSQQMEDLRMIAQTLAAAEERLRDLLSTSDKDGSVYSFADATLKHVAAARKTFRGIV